MNINNSTSDRVIHAPIITNPFTANIKINFPPFKQAFDICVNVDAEKNRNYKQRPVIIQNSANCNHNNGHGNFIENNNDSDNGINSVYSANSAKSVNYENISEFFFENIETNSAELRSPAANDHNAKLLMKTPINFSVHILGNNHYYSDCNHSNNSVNSTENNNITNNSENNHNINNNMSFSSLPETELSEFPFFTNICDIPSFNDIFGDDNIEDILEYKEPQNPASVYQANNRRKNDNTLVNKAQNTPNITSVYQANTAPANEITSSSLIDSPMTSPIMPRNKPQIIKPFIVPMPSPIIRTRAVNSSPIIRARAVNSSDAATSTPEISNNLTYCITDAHNQHNKELYDNEQLQNITDDNEERYDNEQPQKTDNNEERYDNEQPHNIMNNNEPTYDPYYQAPYFSHFHNNFFWRNEQNMHNGLLSPDPFNYDNFEINPVNELQSPLFIGYNAKEIYANFDDFDDDEQNQAKQFFLDEVDNNKSIVINDNMFELTPIIEQNPVLYQENNDERKELVLNNGAAYEQKRTKKRKLDHDIQQMNNNKKRRLTL